MPTNLRSIPIEGYITDNAGNIVRNTTVIIKEDTPSGSNIVDTVKSDDDGYFISKPIKNGLYDIYESGVRVFRQYHSSQPTVIQCYKPGISNTPTWLAGFSEYTSSNIPTIDINDYKSYVQIEPETLNTTLYGHQFPLWNINPYDISMIGNDHSFKNITKVHNGLDANTSRLTHTRFDAELFLPLYAQNVTHKRVRWAGIPGLMFYGDSKIVLPLDYYGIVPNHFYNTITPSSNITWAIWNSDPTLIRIDLGATDYNNFYTSLTTGDIIEVSFSTTNMKFWCILYYKFVESNRRILYGRMWKSSYAVAGDNLSNISVVASSTDINKIICYQGMYSGMEIINQSTSEYITVSENLMAQNSVTELYNYDEA